MADPKRTLVKDVRGQAQRKSINPNQGALEFPTAPSWRSGGRVQPDDESKPTSFYYKVIRSRGIEYPTHGNRCSWNIAGCFKRGLMGGIYTKLDVRSWYVCSFTKRGGGVPLYHKDHRRVCCRLYIKCEWWFFWSSLFVCVFLQYYCYPTAE